MLEQCYSHTMRYCCCCCCWVTSVMSDSVRPHSRQPTRLPRLWDSPGKNTGVGCHFLLQCKKVKSESEVSQSCLTLWEPMDCSLPGSSVHGIFQARVLEWGAIAFSNNEILVISKKQWAIDTCNNLNESPRNLEGWKKKAYLIRLHTVSFHYIIFLRWQIYSNGGDISGSSSWRKCKRSEYDYKMDPCADKNVLCPDLSISVSWLR